MFDPTRPRRRSCSSPTGTDVGSSVPAGKVLARAPAAATCACSRSGSSRRSFNAPALQRLASTSQGTYIAASSPAQLAPIFDALGRQLSSEYLRPLPLAREPEDPRRSSASRSRASPGVATAQYTTPALHIVPVGAYHPSAFDRVVQSRLDDDRRRAASRRARRLGGEPARRRDAKDALVERVSGFVSVQRPRGVRSPPDAGGAGRALAARARPPERVGLAPGWADRLGSTLELADVERGAGPARRVHRCSAPCCVMIILGALIGAPGVADRPA